MGGGVKPESSIVSRRGRYASEPDLSRIVPDPDDGRGFASSSARDDAWPGQVSSPEGDDTPEGKTITAPGGISWGSSESCIKPESSIVSRRGRYASEPDLSHIVRTRMKDRDSHRPLRETMRDGVIRPVSLCGLHPEQDHGLLYEF